MGDSEASKGRAEAEVCVSQLRWPVEVGAVVPTGAHPPSATISVSIYWYLAIFDEHLRRRFPVIFGWIAQKYSTVPAVENVCENLSSVSRALERNFPSLSVTKCGMSSARISETFHIGRDETRGPNGGSY
jgi:hypothetical protein